MIEVEEIPRTFQAIVSDARFTEGRHVVFDARGSLMNPSLSELKSMLATVNAVSSRFSGKWAIVVSDPLRYGLSRMASSLASPLGMKMNAFHSIAEADVWLKEESED